MLVVNINTIYVKLFLNLIILDSFEFYMFNFALYGLKLAGDDFSNYNADSNDPSVYKSLCLDYLYYFLPLQHSASMILPQLTFNVLSSTPNEKQYTRTGSVKNICDILSFL